MRKHLLVGAAVALVFAAPAYASENEIEQSGENNLAVITQEDGADGYSFLDQSGSDNATFVYQADGSVAPTGVLNDSNIDQDGSNNVATVTQLSSGGPGDDANTSSIVQSNTTDVAFVFQAGTGNDSEIVQHDSGLGFASVNQFGSANSSAILQDGANAVATVLQDGSGNVSGIEQSGLGTFAAVGQLGHNNTSAITQHGVGDSVFLGQTGDMNEALIEQNSVGSIITVSQLSAPGGPGNYVNLLQDSATAAALEILQIGEGNSVGSTDAPFVQSSTQWFVDIDQFGKNNSVDGFQKGEKVKLTSLQDGAWNSLVVEQDAEGVDVGALAVLLLPRDLGRHPAQRARLRRHLTQQQAALGGVGRQVTALFVGVRPLRALHRKRRLALRKPGEQLEVHGRAEVVRVGDEHVLEALGEQLVQCARAYLARIRG